VTKKQSEVKQEYKHIPGILKCQQEASSFLSFFAFDLHQPLLFQLPLAMSGNK